MYVRSKHISAHKPFNLWHRVKVNSTYDGVRLYDTECGLIFSGKFAETTEDKPTENICWSKACQQ